MARDHEHLVWNIFHSLSINIPKQNKNPPATLNISTSNSGFFLLIYTVLVHLWQPYPSRFSNRMELILCWSQISILIIMGFSFSVDTDISLLPEGFRTERGAILAVAQFFTLFVPVLYVAYELFSEIRERVRMRKLRDVEDEIEENEEVLVWSLVWIKE